MSEVAIRLLVIIGGILPILLICLDIVFFVKKKECVIFELIAFSVGIGYMVIAYAVWDLPKYTKPINVYGVERIHEPFNLDYYAPLLLFGALGLASYLLLKFLRRKLPPMVEVFLLAGIYAGIVLCAVIIFQLMCGANPVDARMGDLYPNADNPDAIYRLGMGTFDVAVIFCLCVVPALYLIHAIHLLVRIVKEKAQKQQEIQYKNLMLRKMNQWLLSGANLFWMAIVALLPVFGLIIPLILLFGQQPDSIIKVFTQTSDWVLSTEISPPPVAYDTHYLCTVALRGHRRVVKPTRYGIRRGEKIVVNRQLCVANAFEQLIEEKTPNLHRKIRRFYDTYGYPISKHIKSAFAADVVYILMKPLEWFFVFVLYLCDAEPENRISIQYMPKIQR